MLETEKRWLLWTLVDPSKFILFYDKYYDRIYSYLFRMTLDPELAKDLTADTFLKAQRHLKRFSWRSVSFGSWLYKIATNEFRAHYRKNKNNRAVEFDGNSIPNTTNLALTELLMEEQERIVYHAVASLGQPAQDIFFLHYWEGRTVKQISYILKIPKGTVSSHLRRGREKLKRRLGGCYSGDLVLRSGLEKEKSAD